MKEDSPDYHEQWLKHKVSTFGTKEEARGGKFLYTIWRECSCGMVWGPRCFFRDILTERSHNGKVQPRKYL